MRQQLDRSTSRQRSLGPIRGQNGLMRTFLIMLLPMLVASLLGVKARRTYLRGVATAAASSRADKS